MQVSPIFDAVWKTMRRCLNGSVGVAFAAALLVVITYQLVSKPATAQGITYALSGKAAKLATAAPAVRFSQPNLVVSVSAASYIGAQLAPEAIVAAFGNGLATGTRAAAVVPLPTTLNGTTVNVRDSAGTERLAALFFVSPMQVNYQIPQGTATGVATVTVTSGSGTISVGTMQIATIAPGLFSFNANGQGVAAASALRVKANGVQSYENIARFDQTQIKFVPVPIDLSAATDQVFLILYGTGVRYNCGLANVAAMMGGTKADVFLPERKAVSPA